MQLTADHAIFFKNIAILNDAMRTTGMAAYYCPSHGVDQLTIDQFYALYSAVRSYNDFTLDDDPLGCHGQGKIELFGKAFIWRFEYEYPDNELLEFCDPRIVRKIAVMLMEELPAGSKHR